jgi:signal transduction histidine kinase
LLSNAEKYSGEIKDIRVELKARGNLVEITVSDRGLGVPSGSAEKIFEQFYRAHDSLASGIQGSGLGLTLARQIARGHGGDVTHEPRTGGGSCFTLRLPLAEDLEA